MKKNLLALLCCVLLGTAWNCTHAQVPGYMGKRLSLHYEPQFMYAFLAGYFDVHHNASLEYVTSLRHVIGVRYGFSNLKDSYDYEQGIVTPTGTYYDDVNAEVRDKVHSATVFVKFFNKRHGYIAPTGAYTAFGLSFLRSKSEVQQDMYSDFTLYNEGDVLATDNNIALYFGRGRQFVFADRIIFNMAAHLGLPLIWRVSDENDLNMRVGLSYIFRAQIGIGFLAF